MFNHFTAIARVVAEAQGREVGDTVLGTMRMVTSKSRKIKGEWVENPFFFTCVAFGKQAERLSTFKKGELLLVSGDIECSEYRSKDGQAKTQFNLHLGHIERMASVKGDDDDIDLNGNEDLPF